MLLDSQVGSTGVAAVEGGHNPHTFEMLLGEHWSYAELQETFEAVK